MISSQSFNNANPLDVKGGQHLIAKKPQNITHFIQSHPYQYLRQLNMTFNYYQKANTNNRCYSSASRVKLPWKQFKPVKIPQCFKQTFMQEKRDSNQQNTNQDNDQNQNQKKFWKQHAQILKRYHRNKNQKKIESKISLTSSRINKQNNKALVDKLVNQNRKNLFLKKIIEKGARLNYNQSQLEQQVLNKLAFIRDKGTLRAKTAGYQRTRPQSKNSFKRNMETSGQLKNTSMKQNTIKLQPAIHTDSNQFLQFERKQDLISNYQRRITQIDCSISENNLKKTIGIIKQMQNILQS